MKNIQEILLKSGGNGRLILGDEVIDVNVKSLKSSIQRVSGYRDMDGECHDSENIVLTELEVHILGEDFSRMNKMEK